jgi:hypothetical protein
MKPWQEKCAFDNKNGAKEEKWNPLCQNNIHNRIF